MSYVDENNKVFRDLEKSKKVDIISSLWEGEIPEPEDQEMFLIIREAINKWDPGDFFSCGCPKDEYDCENKIITSLINQSYSIEEIADCISCVFSFVFKELENECTLEKCLLIAQEIRESINSK